MITNPAWFALLPVILLASLSSVSAKERIVPAVCEPVQVIPVYLAIQTGKATPGALLFSHSRQSKNSSLSCARCYMLEPGEDDQKTGHVRGKESGRGSFHRGISDNERYPVQINREMS
jgi:cytochrome c peroxidase